MKTSVIISTYNGAKKLPTILLSIQEQAIKDFELIIVVDGSTDDTIDVLKTWENKFEDFKVISQQNKGRAAVRNTGVRHASGELLLFFDDDLIVDKNCIKEHQEYQQSTNYKNIFVGEIIDDPIATNDNEAFLKYKKHIVASWYKTMFKPERKISEHIFDGDYYLAGANFSLTKTIYNHIGGLDETLNRSEDYEFAIRAKLAGIKTIMGDKYASVIHKDNNNNFKDWVLKARYGEINNAIVYAKDKEKFKVYAPQKKTVTAFIKGIIFRSLANKYAYRFMLSSSAVKNIIPSNILYKSYDLIVAANSKYYPNNVIV